MSYSSPGATLVHVTLRTVRNGRAESKKEARPGHVS